MINYLIIIVILLTSINNNKINEIALTMIGYFLFRWITNYRKCTISYLECKLRGVKKDDGYIYNILNPLFDVNKKHKLSITLRLPLFDDELVYKQTKEGREYTIVKGKKTKKVTISKPKVSIDFPTKD